MHPHVHLVVKAEGTDGRRLHIDKAILREWRQDFARMMRDQGITANATPRSVRGQSKRADRDAAFRTRERRSSHELSAQVASIAAEISKTGTIRLRPCARPLRRPALDRYVYYAYNWSVSPTFDPEKNAANIAKHGVSLAEGDGVLHDPLALTIEDDSSQLEVRWVTIE